MAWPPLPATGALWLADTALYSASSELVACFPVSAAANVAEWQPEPGAAAVPLSPAVPPPAAGAFAGAARAAAVLRATVAHPQGGGQPGDSGIIAMRGDSGDAGYALAFVFHTARRDLRGDAVLHVGAWARVAAPAGATDAWWQSLADSDAAARAAVTALGAADAEAALAAALPAPAARAGLQVTGASLPCAVFICAPARRLAARLHSAGHLLDAAVRRVVAAGGLAPLTAGKGFHFAEGPWVEYNGDVKQPADFATAVQAACAALLAADAATVVRSVEGADACAAAGLAPADTAHLPAGAPVRLVAVGAADNVCPCGGTHVARAGEIGALLVTKLTSKKGKTRVSYAVNEAAT
jgi:misacylated tRNA(Ala) deacylase